MATREDQLKLEAESMQMGIDQYRKELLKHGHGELPPGLKLTKAAVVPTTEAIQQWVADAKAGAASRNAGVVMFIDQFEPEALAWVTARAVISSLHNRGGIGKIAAAIATTLEDSQNIDMILKANPVLGRKVTRKLASFNKSSQRVVFIRRGAEYVGAQPIQWNHSTRVRVGTTLIHLFVESTGLVTVAEMSHYGKTHQYLAPTASTERWLSESHQRCELLRPALLPMVVQPQDWTSPTAGGYLTEALRKNRPLVKTRNKAYLEELSNWNMPNVYAAVNAQQQTAWSINLPVFDVVKEAWDRGLTMALPSRDPLPLPAKPWTEGEEPAPDALKAWKQQAVQVHSANARLLSKRLQLMQKLWIAGRMVEYGNVFHYVYNLDWRGRMYPVAQTLTPQGDDLCKGLLHFTAARRLGDNGAYWLAVHGANSFGVDKVSFEDRIKWVQDNEQDILASAADPLSHQFWAGAENPWQFLAFCFEWRSLTRWVVDLGKDQEDFPSTLPVSFDGTCNGLQNYSALLRDPIGGAATGLVPTDKPSDVYTQVAAKAQEMIDADAAAGNAIAKRWVGKMTRTLAKRNTMTVPYGVSRFGMADQMMEEFQRLKSNGEGEGLDLSFESAKYLADTNYAAIGKVVVAARRAMDWLQEVARVAASNELPVRWTAPSGFMVLQDYRVEEGERLDFTVLGKRYRIMLKLTGTKLNKKKQASGIAPNFVHSLDAAHLVRTVLLCSNAGITDFAMVHDSYGVHAGAAEDLTRLLRQAFVEQYSQPVLEAFLEELSGQLPDELREKLPALPEVGTLDLSGVMHSDYFFA